MPGCRYDYDCPYDRDFEVEDETDCMNCEYWEDDDDAEEEADR